MDRDTSHVFYCNLFTKQNVCILCQISVLIYTPGKKKSNKHINSLYTTLTDFSTKYLVMCKVYTDVGGIKYLYHVCQPVCKIIYSLKLVDYLHVQADNPWYNYYVY